jgi:serine/threonine protein kinase
MESGSILGRGSEGCVRVIDSTTVVKCCRQPNDGLYNGVLNETSVLAQYRHPHLIAPLGPEPFAFGDADFSTRLPYFPRSLAVQPPRVMADITRVAYELLSALAFLHGQGIIHTDLKPNNILFDAQGKAVLIDFGQSIRDYGQPKSLEVQAAFWRAPEIILQDQYYTSAIDLWALGLILYNLVCPEGPVLNAGGGNWRIMWGYYHHLPYPVKSWPPRPREKLILHRLLATPEAQELKREVAELWLPDTCPAVLQRVIRTCLDFDARTRVSAAHALTFFTDFPPPPTGEVLPFLRGQPLPKEGWQYCEEIFPYLNYLPKEAQVLAIELYTSAEVRRPSAEVNKLRLLACTYIAAQQLASHDVSQSTVFATSYCPWEKLFLALQEVARLLNYCLHPPLPPVEVANEYHEGRMSAERQELYRAGQFAALTS